MEQTLEHLEGLGYLDDAAFARALVARRAGRRGQALIAAELSARGVPRAVAERVLGELSRAEQVAAARQLAARPTSADRRRLAGRLQRRGFAADVVREALAGLPD